MIDRVWDLTILAVPVHPVTEITKMMFHILLPSSAARMSIRGRPGRVIKRSVILIRIESGGPRKYPETNPMTVPIATPNALASSPTIKETLLPQINWLYMSRPT